MIDVQLKNSALSIEDCSLYIQDPKSGGHAIFVGRVRESTKNRQVISLDFEAYEPMAIKEMEKIAKSICEKWGVCKVCIHHRLGLLNVEEIAVIIGVSSPHRQAAFEGCQYAIDTLKKTVPIWKKEIFEDGEVWVSATP